MTQKHHSDEHIWVVFLRHLMKERGAQSKNVTMDKVGGSGRYTAGCTQETYVFTLLYIL